MRSDAGRAHELRTAAEFSQDSSLALSGARVAQVLCVAALPNGDMVSGSGNSSLKTWADVDVKMARLVALHHLHEMNVAAAGRLIAAFL